MTIVEAIKSILANNSVGLTCKEITMEILKGNLYSFKAADPNHIVNSQIRRHCQGLDFPTSHPVKYFQIVSGERGGTIYRLITDQVNTYTNPIHIQPEVSSNELLPIEEMQKFYTLHKERTKEQLLDYILNNAPAFFESMVVELLLNLGYGYGVGAGRVVGKSHDGGIDGVINEDQLGLDKIYIQAKRHSPSHKISSKELQAFIGAMKSVNKGVFITTSSYTKAAKDYANEQQQKSISLIDGFMLAELLITHGIGIRTIKTYSIYEIDSEYFDDD